MIKFYVKSRLKIANYFDIQQFNLILEYFWL